MEEWLSDLRHLIYNQTVAQTTRGSESRLFRIAKSHHLMAFCFLCFILTQITKKYTSGTVDK